MEPIAQLKASLLAVLLLAVICTGCTESGLNAVFGEPQTVLVGLTMVDGADALLIAGCDLPELNGVVGRAAYQDPEWTGAAFVFGEEPNAKLIKRESPVPFAQLLVLDPSFDRSGFEEVLKARPVPQDLAIRLSSLSEVTFELDVVPPSGQWPEYPTVLRQGETDARWSEGPSASLEIKC